MVLRCRIDLGLGLRIWDAGFGCRLQSSLVVVSRE